MTVLKSANKRMRLLIRGKKTSNWQLCIEPTVNYLEFLVLNVLWFSVGNSKGGSYVNGRIGTCVYVLNK